MSLSSQIDTLKTAMATQVPPEALAAMSDAARELAASGVAAKALKVGAEAPGFALPDAHGRTVCLEDLLKAGPVVLVFYRGLWCPFCNLTLAALQQALPQIGETGATLVAVSPQTPSATEHTSQTLQIAFPMLSDAGNETARAYGLVFTLAAEMRPIYEALGVDLRVVNGDASYELPLAATYVIGRDHKVAYAFVDSDYTHRMEPADITRVLQSL